MMTKTTRKIVHIDESLCNGCGACAIKCAEGALQIIDGKARLLSETYCDGLGACLGECPQGAIAIEERPAAGFDEAAVARHLHHGAESRACDCASGRMQEFRHEIEDEHDDIEAPGERLACGCPSATIRDLGCNCVETGEEVDPVKHHARSRLSHFPVQLALVPPTAPFLRHADVLLAADCTSFAYDGFHEDFLKGHALLIACPKLDDFEAHQERLTQILRQAAPRSLTVLRMEVPCCGGLAYLARQAVKAAGLEVPVQEIVVSARGEVIRE